MEKILHLESDKAQIGVFDVDWQQIQKGSAEFARSTRFAEIRSGGSPEKLRDLQDLGPRILLEKDPRKQLELVQQYVTDLMCSWTDTSPSDIDFNSSLYNYGMDSFVGLTFKMQIESSLQLSFEVRLVHYLKDRGGLGGFQSSQKEGVDEVWVELRRWSWLIRLWR